MEEERVKCDSHEDNEESQSYLNWPRLSSPSYTATRPAPKWTTILGPSQVLVFPNFLTVQDTNALIEYIQHEMKVQIDDKIDPSKPRPRPVPRPGYAFRDNDRIQFNSADFANMLWNKCGLRDRWTELWMHPKWGLESVQGESITSRSRNSKRIRHAVGLSHNIRLYRYQQSQSFGAHYDDSVVETNEDNEETISEYTVLIYLNGEKDSDLLGGETVFYPKGKNPAPVTTSTSGPGKQTRKGTKSSKGSEDLNTSSNKSSSSSSPYILPNGGVAVKPERGLLLVHKHGDECMLHEALIVNRGFKYVVRTDVVYEP